MLAKWRRALTADPALDRAVWDIIEAVRRGGDRAVADCARRFDGVVLRPAEFRIAPEQLKQAWDSLPADLQGAIDLARGRIARFHLRQRRKGFVLKDSAGATLEQRVLPLDSVGLYIPGGKAAYPSTVLMCAVPAFAAGVRRVAMVTPPRADGSLPQRATWGAAWRAGVREAYRIGGAQAVAALAFGTKTIARVDKIVGPGNRFVAAAKKLLYGQIDIDSVAGPSEVMILADETARPDFIAADLMAQAEHDEAASAILALIGAGKKISALGKAVERRLAEMTERSPRKRIAQASLKRNGAVIFARQEAQAAEIANLRAPEHLEIMTREPRKLAGLVRNAGAIFLGPWCPEAFGDYIAGPNHTLPTGGTARFFSPLSLDDFVKTNNVLEASQSAMKKLGATAALLADVEGLAAHAESLRLRIQE
ncbi:MAG: histidinol dehydrogenase [Candidatus Sumerlaeota bacterium]|nr:histidinol dehydrogenase [Candidatus Sumerlaeota bacterium]